MMSFKRTEIKKPSTTKYTTRDRLNCLIHDAINNSCGKEIVSLSPEISEALGNLRQYMFKYLYTNPIAKCEEKKADMMLELLYNYYMEDVSRLTNECVELILTGEDQRTVVCDYIAGMTDNYATQQFKDIYVPKSWKGGKDPRYFGLSFRNLLEPFLGQIRELSAGQTLEIDLSKDRKSVV